jgi:hypothetical protein
LAWERRIKKAFPNLTTPLQGTICELHFSEDDIDFSHQKALIRGAMPYINADILDAIAITRSRNESKPVSKFGNSCTLVEWVKLKNILYACFFFVPAGVDLYLKSIDLELNLNTVCRFCLISKEKVGRLMTEKDKEIIWKAGILVRI